LKIVEQRLDGSDGQPGNRFDRQSVQDAVFNDRQYAGELWRDSLVQLCNTAPAGYLLGSTGPVDVSAACPVLAAWDRHDNLDSPGAVLFRRFASRALANPLPVSVPIPIVGDLLTYSTAFNASDPVNTPSGLNILSPKVSTALADAVTDLRSSNIPLDASLRDWQYEVRNGERIPIHGGPGTLGVFNALNTSWVPGKGYPDVAHGSSFVMVTQFTNGCPDDRSILTYSQSENPASPYFSDQTRMFSNKQWVNPPYCENEIAADPSLQTTRVSDQPDVAAAKKHKKCKRHKRKHVAKKAKKKKKRCVKKHRKPAKRS
jgi:acyl-homoserine-lactone acylase